MVEPGTKPSKDPRVFRAKTARAMAWRLGLAAVSLAALVVSVLMSEHGSASHHATAHGGRVTAVMIGLAIGGIAGAVHTWRTAPRIVVHDDALELDDWFCRVRGIEMARKNAVRDEYERCPPFDVLSIVAVDKGGKPRTMQLRSHDWPDIGAVESAVRELVQRAARGGPPLDDDPPAPG
jgi:hypothetical protein